MDFQHEFIDFFNIDSCQIGVNSYCDELYEIFNDSHSNPSFNYEDSEHCNQVPTTSSTSIEVEQTVVDFQQTLIQRGANQEARVDNSNSSNSSSPRRTPQSRVHLCRDRRKRGEKNEIEESVDGYWTKNFLQWGKKVHINFMLKHLKKIGDKQFFQRYPEIQQIKDKAGITMYDYLVLYRNEELRVMWREFFRCKQLHRGLMLSRVEPQFRVIFVKFIYRYEKAFIDDVFDHIAQ